MTFIEDKLLVRSSVHLSVVLIRLAVQIFNELSVPDRLTVLGTRNVIHRVVNRYAVRTAFTGGPSVAEASIVWMGQRDVETWIVWVGIGTFFCLTRVDGDHWKGAAAVGYKGF